MTVPILERDLQDAVVDAARLFGYRVFHTRPARTGKGWRTPVQYDGKGFPDLVLARPGRLMFVELKTGGGTVSQEQAGWIDVLSTTDAEMYVFTNQHWPDRVLEVLR